LIAIFSKVIMRTKVETKKLEKKISIKILTALCVAVATALVTTSQTALADSTGAYDAGAAQARVNYFGGGSGQINCPTSWDTDYCALYKVGFGVEWNLQKVLRPELDGGR
jgi:hypothetical protein